MPRAPRVQFQGAIYHVMSRGNRKATIFEDDDDRRRFLDIFAEAAERYTVTAYSYCLMGNHYHAVIETPCGNVSAAMGFINGGFTQASNRRHDWTGHLLGGRFKSLTIDDHVYLRNANAYVVLNPVAAGLVSAPVDWVWSSYRATAGLATPPEFLSLDWLESVFGGPTHQDAQRRYREFVSAPPDTLDADIEGGVLYGSASFEERVRSAIGVNLYRARVPREYRALARPPLPELFEGRLSKRERNSRILRAHVVHGYRLSEIAASLGLHPNTLSKIVQGLKKRRARLEV